MIQDSNNFLLCCSTVLPILGSNESSLPFFPNLPMQDTSWIATGNQECFISRAHRDEGFIHLCLSHIQRPGTSILVFPFNHLASQATYFKPKTLHYPRRQPHPHLSSSSPHIHSPLDRKIQRRQIRIPRLNKRLLNGQAIQQALRQAQRIFNHLLRAQAQPLAQAQIRVARRLQDLHIYNILSTHILDIMTIRNGDIANVASGKIKGARVVGPRKDGRARASRDEKGPLVRV